MTAFEEQLLSNAVEHGTFIGQTSLAEYLLKSYELELSPQLEIFLQKVCENGYNNIGESVGQPAEDVALAVGQIMEKVR